MTKAETEAFKEATSFEATVMLRRCDDGGKDASLRTRGLDYYRDLMVACLRSSA